MHHKTTFSYQRNGLEFVAIIKVVLKSCYAFCLVNTHVDCETSSMNHIQMLILDGIQPLADPGGGRIRRAPPLTAADL